MNRVKILRRLAKIVIRYSFRWHCIPQRRHYFVLTCQWQPRRYNMHVTGDCRFELGQCDLDNARWTIATQTRGRYFIIIIVNVVIAILSPEGL